MRSDYDSGFQTIIKLRFGKTMYTNIVTKFQCIIVNKNSHCLAGPKEFMYLMLIIILNFYIFYFSKIYIVE